MIVTNWQYFTRWVLILVPLGAAFLVGLYFVVKWAILAADAERLLRR